MWSLFLLYSRTINIDVSEVDTKKDTSHTQISVDLLLLIKLLNHFTYSWQHHCILYLSDWVTYHIACEEKIILYPLKELINIPSINQCICIHRIWYVFVYLHRSPPKLLVKVKKENRFQCKARQTLRPLQKWKTWQTALL